MTRAEAEQALVAAVKHYAGARDAFTLYGRVGPMAVTRRHYRDQEIEAERAVCDAAIELVAAMQAEAR